MKFTMKLIYTNSLGIIKDIDDNFNNLLSFVNSNRIKVWVMVNTPYYNSNCNYTYKGEGYSIQYHRDYSLRETHIETYLSPNQHPNYWENQNRLIEYMRKLEDMVNSLLLDTYDYGKYQITFISGFYRNEYTLIRSNPYTYRDKVIVSGIYDIISYLEWILQGD